MSYSVIGKPKIIPTVAPTQAPTLAPPSFDKLTTARKISMTGDIAYQQSFDGSADVTGVATLSNTGVVAGSYPVLTVDAKGRVTSGRALATADLPAIPSPGKLATARNITITGDVSYQQSFDGSADVTGVATLSNTGIAAGTYIVTTVDAKGRVTSGRALATADLPAIPSPGKLATARNITMTGDVSYQQSFDGSVDVTGAATLSSTGVVAGTYPVLTVDAKGRVTSGRALATTDLPAIPSPGKLATARNITMTGDIAYQQSFDGSADVTGVATLSNTGVVAGSYPVLTVDAKGRVTSGRALATTDIPVDLMNRIKYLESMVTILSSRP